MYHIRDSYVGRAFTWTPVSILLGLLLFLASNFYGQILFGLGGWLAGWIGVDSGVSGICFGFIPFCLAALSGVGLVFILLDVWLLYELLYEEGVRTHFFYWVAAFQIGMCLCASIPAGEFFQSLLPALFAWAMFKLVAWTFTKVEWKLFGFS